MHQCVFNCVIIDYVYMVDIKAICSVAVIMDLCLGPIPLPARGSWLLLVEPECHQKQHSATNIVTMQPFHILATQSVKETCQSHEYTSTYNKMLHHQPEPPCQATITIYPQLFLLICSGKVGMKHSV